MVVAAPRSVTPHKEFMANTYILKKEEGGRHTPFQANYRPQFFVRTGDVTGSIEELTHPETGEVVEFANPGDYVMVRIILIVPVAVEEGLRFAIREGGRTIGTGVVTKIVA